LAPGTISDASGHHQLWQYRPEKRHVAGGRRPAH
jgi:hypothetical protein